MRRPATWYITAVLVTILASAAVGQTVPSSAPQVHLVSRRGKRVPTIAFHGKLTALDLTAGSFTLGRKNGGRVIYVSGRTRISCDGRRVTLASAKIGEEASGQFIERADGKREALSLRFGVNPSSQTRHPGPKHGSTLISGGLLEKEG